MHARSMRIVVASAFVAFATASGPTKLYIDSVPEYDLLAPCAEHEVSMVVRSMAYGCGDGSQTTSYACFCYKSSAYYSRMISTRVTSACSKSGGPENSAVEVFSKYCQLGEIEQATTTRPSFSEIISTSTGTGTGTATSAPTTNASPASNPTVATSSPTGRPIPQTTPPPPKKKKKNTSAIAAGITVPVVVIALCLVGLFVYLRNRKRKSQATLPTDNQTVETSGTISVHNKHSNGDVYEKDNDVRHEMDVSNQREELPGSTVDQDRNGKIAQLVANTNRS